MQLAADDVQLDAADRHGHGFREAVALLDQREALPPVVALVIKVALPHARWPLGLAVGAVVDRVTVGQLVDRAAVAHLEVLAGALHLKVVACEASKAAAGRVLVPGVRAGVGRLAHHALDFGRVLAARARQPLCALQRAACCVTMVGNALKVTQARRVIHVDPIGPEVAQGHAVLGRVARAGRVVHAGFVAGVLRVVKRGGRIAQHAHIRAICGEEANRRGAIRGIQHLKDWGQARRRIAMLIGADEKLVAPADDGAVVVLEIWVPAVRGPHRQV